MQLVTITNTNIITYFITRIIIIVIISSKLNVKIWIIIFLVSTYIFNTLHVNQKPTTTYFIKKLIEILDIFEISTALSNSVFYCWSYKWNLRKKYNRK